MSRRPAPPRRGLRRRQRGNGPLLVLGAAATVPALLLWALANWASERADAFEAAAGQTLPATSATSATSVAAAPVATLNTGLLSFRRTAALLSRQLNLAGFQQGAQPLMGLLNDRSCAAISLDGELVAEANTDTVVIPASTMKVLIAAVAEEVLGDDFTYRTRVVGASPVGGVVTGDVFLVGGGDPLLSGEWYPASSLDRFPAFNITSLDELARRLAAAGVTRIDGAIRGDGSRYDDELYAPGWGADVAGIEAGPYDALLVNDSRVAGDDQRGSDPNEAGAREFVRILAEQGIEVSGGAGVGTAPVDAAELVSIESQPLAAVLAEMLTNSDNNTAELLLKEVGLAASGSGTRQAGIAAVMSTLAGWGVDTAGLVVSGGSGLSLDDRLSCTTLLDVLQHAGFDSAVGQGLAVAGETGTLAEAFADTSVAGRLRGKTGTLNNVPYDQDPPAVKTLAGFLPVDGGGAIEYVLLLNGPTINDQREYRPIWAELVTALTSFPSVVSPAALGPR